jgi:prefoldin subunit 5
MITIKEQLEDCERELAILNQTISTIRQLIHTSYSTGADLSFLEQLDTTIVLLRERILVVESNQTLCQRKLA